MSASSETEYKVVGRIVLRAFVQANNGQESCGGTSIYIDVRAGISPQEMINRMALIAAGEIARYLGHECMQALRWKIEGAKSASANEVQTATNGD